MNYLTDAQSLEFAAILDGYEETVATANAGKTDTLDDIRGALRKAGLKGSELADELASFREAVAERRLIRTNPQKAERKSKKRDGATDYLFVLTAPASRTHEGRNLTAGETACLDRALLRGTTPFDPVTGEIVTTVASSGAPAIEPGTDVAAPESCGSDEGIAVQADSTLAGKQDTYPAAGAAEQGTAACAESDDETVVASQPVVEPGPQDRPRALSPQQHKTIDGKSLTPSAMPDIPAFLDRRTPTQGTA